MWRSIRWLCCCAVLVACAPAPQEADLVVRNATLVIGDGTIVEGAAVVVRGGRIAAAGTNIGDWNGAEEIDAAGKAVLPGLIDSHVHLLALVSESPESVARFREETLPEVLDGFLSMGVTTIRSTGDPLEAILELREQLADGRVDGPRLLAGGPVLCAVDGHPAVTVCSLFEDMNWCRANLARELPDAEEAETVVAELAEAGVDFIKVVYDKDLGAPLELSILEAIVRAGQARGLRVVVHASPGSAGVDAIGVGADGLVHLPFGDVERETLVESMGSVPISGTLGLLTPFPDPTGNLRTPYTPWTDSMAPAREEMLETAAALWNGGSPLAFGTDTPMFTPDQSWPQEIRGLIDAGFTPADILVMATRNAAGALGLQDELGTLEVGKRADLVLIDGAPHEDLDALQSVVLVVKDGAIVIDNR